jgi:hypothetical protein
VPGALKTPGSYRGIGLYACGEHLGAPQLEQKLPSTDTPHLVQKLSLGLPERGSKNFEKGFPTMVTTDARRVQVLGTRNTAPSCKAARSTATTIHVQKLCVHSLGFHESCRVIQNHTQHTQKETSMHALRSLCVTPHQAKAPVLSLASAAIIVAGAPRTGSTWQHRAVFEVASIATSPSHFKFGYIDGHVAGGVLTSHEQQLLTARRSIVKVVCTHVRMA